MTVRSLYDSRINFVIKITFGDNISLQNELLSFNLFLLVLMNVLWCIMSRNVVFTIPIKQNYEHPSLGRSVFRLVDYVFDYTEFNLSIAG